MTTRPDLAQRSSRAAARRLLLRSAVVAGSALGLAMLTPVAAFAAGPDVNGVDGHVAPLGTVNFILIFALLPLAVLGIITLIFMRPGSGAQRYRPGRGWNAQPTWIGVPAREDHDAPALEGARALQQAAGTAPDDELESASGARQDPNAGGARGSW